MANGTMSSSRVASEPDNYAIFIYLRFLTEYPGARHAFDNPLYQPVRFMPDAQLPNRCRREELRGGVIINLDTGQPFSSKDTCVTHGATLGYDPNSHAESVTAVTGFLKAALLLSNWVVLNWQIQPTMPPFNGLCARICKIVHSTRLSERHYFRSVGRPNSTFSTEWPIKRDLAVEMTLQGRDDGVSATTVLPALGAWKPAKDAGFHIPTATATAAVKLGQTAKPAPIAHFYRFSCRTL